MFKNLFVKRISQEQQLINTLNQFQSAVMNGSADINQTAEQLDNMDYEAVEKYLVDFNNNKYFKGAVTYFNFLKDFRNRNKGYIGAYAAWLNELKSNIENNMIYEF